MPIRYRIDFDEKIIHTEAYGLLTDDDILKMKEEIYSNLLDLFDFRELSDMTQVERFEVTTEGIKKMVALDAMNTGKLNNYRLAIVADKAVIFGMGRMYEMRTTGNIGNIRIFTNMQEAKDWLNIESQKPKSES